MRGTSANKGADVKFGGRDRSTGSRDRQGLQFGKASAAGGEGVKLDPDSMIIKKKDHELLKEQSAELTKVQTEADGLQKELEATKEEVYNITIKMKKAENKCNTLVRDHEDALEALTAELTEQNKQAHEELVLKHSEERNRLIQEGNKSGDSKLLELRSNFEELEKENQRLQEEMAQTIESMTAAKESELQEQKTTAEEEFLAVKAELEKKLEEQDASLTEETQKVAKMVEKVQSNRAKIDGLEEELQAAKIDLEANQIEIEMLKDEKQELLAEMTENSKLEGEDILNSLSADELKQQNRKLRQAVSSLAQNFEVEREKLQGQVADEEGKKAVIAEYEKKLADMDVLLEELDRKEEELAELKIENEACLEYETMVEEMAQEILKKEEECDELERKVRGMEEVLGIQEGYSENLEQYNQELTEELAEQEAAMAQVEQQKIEDEELLLDLEDENQKYRDKVQLLNKQSKELTEQVERFSESAEEKSKFTTLVEKQNALTKSLRDSENRELDNQIAKIDYHWGTLLKSKVIEGIIPPRLQEHVHFDSLGRLNRLNQSMYRAMLLVRYICEKQMPNVGSMYGGGGDSEELEMKIQFIRMMINVSEQAVMFINSAQRIIICVNNMSVEQYVKATTTLMAWQKLDAVSDEMGHIIEKLKDENISLKFDTSVLEGFIRQVSELHIKIEKLFVEKTPEEVAQEGPAKKDDDKSKYQMSPAQLERQKIIQQSFKLDVRHQALRMCVATVALKVLIGEILGGGGPKNSNFMHKATLIYGRLLDIVFKLDHIDADDTGKEYLNMQDLVIDKRLTEKYDVIKMIWSDVADPVAIQGKDWNSLLDAIQRDITQVLNDYKFKRLIKHIEQSYEKEDGQATVSRIDDIFYIDRFKGALAPWMEISKRIRLDIQNSEALKDKIDQLNLKLKKEVNANLENKRQTEILKVTIKSLEGRLAKAQTEIEQLNSVKGEHESMTKKHNLQKKQLEAATTEAAGLKKYQDELLKKYEDLEKKAADGAVALEQNASYQDNLG